MVETYHKSARTQYPEFLGSRSFKTALDLPPTFCRSTPRSAASTNILPGSGGVRVSRLCFKTGAKNASSSAARKKFVPHNAARRRRPAQLATFAWSGSLRRVRTEYLRSPTLLSRRRAKPRNSALRVLSTAFPKMKLVHPWARASVAVRAR